MIDRHINKFKVDQKKALVSGKKSFATYGNWDDKWNIDKVILNCRNDFIINLFISSN